MLFCTGSQSVSRITLLSLSLGILKDSDKILAWQSASLWRKIYAYKMYECTCPCFFIWTCICMYKHKQKPPRLPNCTTEDIPQLIWRTLWKLCPCSCSTQNSQYDLSGTILAFPLGTTTTLVSVDLYKTLSLSPDHWHDRPKQLQSIVSMCT